MSKQYDILFIQQYLEGTLSHKDMHQLEQDALNDAMLQDAIDGFQLSNINHKQVSLLQQRLANRVAVHHEEKNRFYFTGQRLAVASVAGVMLIASFVLFWIMNTQRNDKALESKQQTEVLVEQPNNAGISLIEGSLIPAEGWTNYKDYLAVNGVEIAAGEKVHLSFEVLESKPVNIKVITSTSDVVSQKLIKLIADGPAWNGKSGEVEIGF